MNVVEELFGHKQYSLSESEKQAYLLAELSALTQFHRSACEPYDHIVANTNPLDRYLSLAEIPFIPVRLFKSLPLVSVHAGNVIKTLTSSGTTNQSVSRIAIDKETALLQTKALAAIVTSYIGPKRLPMMIVDAQETVARGASMSARGAGLVGLSNFGREHFYMLDSNMELKAGDMLAYIAKHRESRILVFGFTFMIWQYLSDYCRRKGIQPDLGNAIVIHGGGWKKLQESAVSNEKFKQILKEQFNIRSVYNFYGMVEQVGSVYMECEHGYFHCPNFADIIIRKPSDWSVCAPGEDGVIQTLSVLPRSYPGHSILTEDIGTVIGHDGCSCGRRGTYFLVHGRMQKAELRGCSDTHASSFKNN